MPLGELTPPTGISSEDGAAPPLSVRALVVAVLERLARVEERLNQTSRNSSKPPSSDPPSVPPRSGRQPSGRKAGGQPGHVGHGRELKRAEHVDHIIDAKPLSCSHCGALLMGEDPQPARHQVTELPPVESRVTEYRRHTLRCLAGGAVSQAGWPVDMPTRRFGPRLQATVGYLTGRVGMSPRAVQEVLTTVLHMEVGLGSIAALEQAVSTAVAAPVEEASRYIQRQPMRNGAEPPWWERAKHLWLWVKSTPLVTAFHLLKPRGAVGAKAVIGEAFPGVVGTDRLAAYHWIAPEYRQVCWAHLKRAFVASSERGADSARLGLAWLAEEHRLFTWWAEVRAGTLSRPDFQVRLLPVMTRVKELLQEGAEVAHAQTQRTCRKLLKLEPALWTFVWDANVEPTNNRAERPLRRAVLWRRRSFGTQSEHGSRFVERILTVVITLRQQKREVLEYLTAACTARLRDATPPTLVPQWRPIGVVP